jgi:hypothetical protein
MGENSDARPRCPCAAKGRLTNTKLGKAVVPLSSAARVDVAEDADADVDDPAVPAPTWVKLQVCRMCLPFLCFQVRAPRPPKWSGIYAYGGTGDGIYLVGWSVTFTPVCVEACVHLVLAIYFTFLLSSVSLSMRKARSFLMCALPQTGMPRPTQNNDGSPAGELLISVFLRPKTRWSVPASVAPLLETAPPLTISAADPAASESGVAF